MKCQSCGSDTQVLETRHTPDGIQRRRRCLSCNARAWAIERWASEAHKPAVIIKAKEQPKPVVTPKHSTREQQKQERNKKAVERRRAIEDRMYYNDDYDYLSGIRNL